MLYYLLFWTILGFIFYFYIIFGTNLLTGGPTENCCFFPISVFRRNGISNGIKSSGTWFSQQTRLRRLGRYVKTQKRRTRGRGRAQGGGRAPTLVGSPGLSWFNSDTPWASSGPKISSVKFQFNWTPFDLPFLRYSKTRKKQKLALGSRLIG